jgi:hypothetical protein
MSDNNKKKTGKAGGVEWHTLLSGASGMTGGMPGMRSGRRTGGAATNGPKTKAAGGIDPSKMMGGMMKMPGMKMPGMTGPGTTGGTTGGTTPEGQGQKRTGSRPTRTEFVVLLVWKEPLPSDVRKGESAESDQESDSGMGGMPGMGGGQ